MSRSQLPPHTSSPFCTNNPGLGSTLGGVRSSLEDSGALWLREQLSPPDELPGVHVSGLEGAARGCRLRSGARCQTSHRCWDVGSGSTGHKKRTTTAQGCAGVSQTMNQETDTHPPFATQRTRRGLHACRHWGPRTGSRGSACGQLSDPSGSGLLGPGWRGTHHGGNERAGLEAMALGHPFGSPTEPQLSFLLGHPVSRLRRM